MLHSHYFNIWCQTEQRIIDELPNSTNHKSDAISVPLTYYQFHSCSKETKVLCLHPLAQLGFLHQPMCSAIAIYIHGCQSPGKKGQCPIHTKTSISPDWLKCLIHPPFRLKQVPNTFDLHESLNKCSWHSD